MRVSLNTMSLSAMFLERLDKHEQQSPSVKIPQYFGDSIATICSTLNDVLLYQSLMENKIEIASNIFNVASLLREVEISCIESISEKQITFQINLDQNISKILIGDSLRIRQILSNFVSHTISYLNEQGGSLQLCARIVSLDSDSAIHTNEDSESIEFLVHVDGCYISEKNQQDLFEEFVSLREGECKARQGSGLGLVVSKKLADLLGGTIGFRSHIRGGSSFFVIIPFSTKLEVKNESSIDKSLYANIKNRASNTSAFRSAPDFVNGFEHSAQFASTLVTPLEILQKTEQLLVTNSEDSDIQEIVIQPLLNESEINTDLPIINWRPIVLIAGVIHVCLVAIFRLHQNNTSSNVSGDVALNISGIAAVAFLASAARAFSCLSIVRPNRKPVLICMGIVNLISANSHLMTSLDLFPIFTSSTGRVLQATRIAYWLPMILIMAYICGLVDQIRFPNVAKQMLITVVFTGIFFVAQMYITSIIMLPIIWCTVMFCSSSIMSMDERNATSAHFCSSHCLLGAFMAQITMHAMCSLLLDLESELFISTSLDVALTVLFSTILIDRDFISIGLLRKVYELKEARNKAQRHFLRYLFHEVYNESAAKKKKKN
jgi:hypothetical protein